MTRRIAMWSGPRNISTAMMRSFSSRPDCFVSDEPFYGAFLKETGADHPLRDEVIASMDTDWQRIAALYAGLAGVAPSPVVELNRAVAVSMASGPAAGLAIVETLVAEPSLAAYHLLPVVHGDLLDRLGRFDEAKMKFEHAASLTRNERERTLLLERAERCESEPH